MHAVDPKQVKANAKWLTQEEIFGDLNLFVAKQEHSTPWVTYSGGNPCIHDLSHLTQRLKVKGWKITVETQGTFCPSWLNLVDIITVSPKGPGMGEQFEQDKYEYFIRMWAGRKSINTKVVIFGDKDLEFAERVARIWTSQGYSMDGFYLSQRNPFPPGKGPPIGSRLHVDLLRDDYLELFDKIKVNPILAHAKWLPQFHVWLWQNKQGV